MLFEEMMKQCNTVDEYIKYCKDIDSWHSIPVEKHIMSDILEYNLENLKQNGLTNILFFGIGRVLDFFQDINLSKINLLGFIDTSKDGTFWGYNIYKLEDIEKLDVDAIIITSKTYSNEMVNVLKTSMSKSKFKDIEIIELFNRDYFKDKILPVYVNNVIDDLGIKSGPTNVLYITLNIITNIIRQSMYLRKTKKYSTHIIKLTSFRTKNNKVHDKYFDTDTDLSGTRIKLWILSKVLPKIKVEIIYVNIGLHLSYLPIFINEYSKSKVIFELKDTAQIFTRNQLSLLRPYHEKNKLDLEYDLEKFAYENLGGLVYKEKENYSKYFVEKVKHDIPTLSFRSYICDELIQNNTSMITNNIKKNLIYCSTVGPTSMPAELDPIGKGMFELFENLLEQGLSITAFLAESSKQCYYDWLHLSKKYENMILKPWTPIDEIYKSNLPFGYGLLLFKNAHKEHWSKNVRKIGLGEKFFSYIEAGLPIIICSSREYISDLVRKYNIGIVVEDKDIPNLSNMILKVDYELLKNNVLELQKNEFNMKNNIGRLIEFFEKVNVI